MWEVGYRVHESDLFGYLDRKAVFQASGHGFAAGEVQKNPEFRYMIITKLVYILRKLQG